MKRLKPCQQRVGIVLSLLLAPLTSAQFDPETTRPWASNVIIPQARPYGLTPSQGRAVTVTGIDVNVEIRETLATTTIEIHLQNATASRQEVEVVLPVSAGAVVRAFSYDGPHGPVGAKVLAKAEARATYERLVAKMRDPALVEFIGYNLNSPWYN